MTVLDLFSSERPPPTPEAAPEARRLEVLVPRSDRIFRRATGGIAIFTLVLMGLIGLFLLLRSWPALQRAGWRFLVETDWLPDAGRFGIAALLFGTIVVACISMLFAFPIAFGASLFISEYAPRRFRRSLVSLVDLMAAVPSIVYALWGFFFLQPILLGVARWLSEQLGPVLPFLRVDDPDTDSSFTSSAFIAGAVVAMTVIPTVTTIMREVFSQAPVAEREAALALGASRWAMIRHVVLPFGRAGVVGGSMLGLGRALGETIAVYLIISPIFELTTHPLQSGTNTISALIATRASESTENGLAALLGAGLVLFAFTLLVNAVAGVVVSRSRSGASTEI